MSKFFNRNWIEKHKLTEPIPQEVRDCGDRINTCGFWWQPSVNCDENGKPRKVSSCREAAQFRNRLGAGGNGGIPLWAELKTRVGQAVDTQAGTSTLFAAHSRANTAFDHSLIIKALGLDPSTARIQTELDSEAPSARWSILSGSKYFGRFNPFNPDRILSESLGIDVKIESVCQIFDNSVQMNGGCPNTVMTNLGHREFGFEIHPNDLISSVQKFSQKVIVANIARPCPIWLGLDGRWKIKKRLECLRFPPPTGPKIGILTGNAPESGLTLWQDILDVFRERYPNLADVLMPEVHVHSLPSMGLSMELVSREEHVWDEMQKAIEGLLGLDCKIITLACNTTIYYEDRIRQLCNGRGVEFISIAKACVATLNEKFAQKDSKIRSIGLLGIGPVVDTAGSYSGYKPHLESAKINVTPCAADALGYAFKQKGVDDKTLATDFSRLINEELANEEIIVLALTEASIIYRKHIRENKQKRRGNRVFVDPLMELAKYLVGEYLRLGYRDCAVCQIPSDYPLRDKVLYCNGEMA